MTIKIFGSPQTLFYRFVIVAAAWSDLAAAFLPLRQLSVFHFICAIIFYLTSFSMIIGRSTRLSGIAFGLFILFSRFYLGLHLGIEDFDHHHLTLLGILSCLISIVTDSKNNLNLKVYRALASSIYLYAALDKLGPHWLSGIQVQSILIKLYWGSVSIPSWSESFSLIFSRILILVELALTVIVWFPKYAKISLRFALLLHILIYLAVPVASFSVLMIMLWALAYPDDWSEAWLNQEINFNEYAKSLENSLK